MTNLVTPPSDSSDSGFRLPVDADERLDILRSTINFMHPAEAIGRTLTARAEAADAYLRRQGIDGNAIQEAYLDSMTDPTVEVATDHGFASDLYARYAKGKVVVAMPGDRPYSQEIESEKNRRHWTRYMFNNIAQDVAPEDASFHDFVDDGLALMTAKGRFYDITRELAADDVMSPLVPMRPLAFEAKKMSDPHRFIRTEAKEMWARILYGEAPSWVEGDDRLEYGLIGANTAQIKYQQKMESFLRDRGVAEEDIDSTHKSVMALMYLKRGQIEPGKVIDTMRSALDAMYTFDADIIDDHIDNLILRNPKIVTSRGAEGRGLSTSDIAELQDMIDFEQQIRVSPLARLATLDESQRGALEFLANAEAHKEMIPAEIAAMTGNTMFNYISRRGNIDQVVLTYMSGGASEYGGTLRPDDKSFRWCYPAFDEHGEISKIATVNHAPAPHLFIRALLNGDLEIARPLSEAEQAIIAGHETKLGARPVAIDQADIIEF